MLFPNISCINKNNNNKNKQNTVFSCRARDSGVFFISIYRIFYVRLLCAFDQSYCTNKTKNEASNHIEDYKIERIRYSFIVFLYLDNILINLVDKEHSNAQQNEIPKYNKTTNELFRNKMKMVIFLVIFRRPNASTRRFSLRFCLKLSKNPRFWVWRKSSYFLDIWENPSFWAHWSEPYIFWLRSAKFLTFCVCVKSNRDNLSFTPFFPHTTQKNSNSAFWILWKWENSAVTFEFSRKTFFVLDWNRAFFFV